MHEPRDRQVSIPFGFLHFEISQIDRGPVANLRELRDRIVAGCRTISNSLGIFEHVRCLIYLRGEGRLFEINSASTRTNLCRLFRESFTNRTYYFCSVITRYYFLFEVNNLNIFTPREIVLSTSRRKQSKREFDRRRPNSERVECHVMYTCATPLFQLSRRYHSRH